MNKFKKIVCSVVAAIGVLAGGGVAIESTIPVGQVVIAGEKVATVKTSPAGFALMGNAEGCRLDPYKCPAGLVTNGIGNTHGVPERPIDITQVAKDWAVNVEQAEQCLINIAPKDNPMSQGQHDAFTSFVFNTGCTRFLKNKDDTSTKIARLIKQGEYVQACGQLKRWVYGGGKKLQGLVTRRDNEYDRCMAVD
ncbi:glycoside hydrolase family protein [Photobacterium phosphoreum]|uniref:Lysozyme n=1 Tax=Photobacterium phosphoreum TaxID=659 RepID=A0AAW4ZP02_PHOPO|nr:lysozyme [Photobacterium phosphoreum]MCD9491064.1 glycoside hydrolase family protein [Photobacterium phosphoreum]MCF2190326.1 glycoside hydrolase family protein [Photobacterium phosphoreum]MCF2300913.1 glycoside hydrolase family protein [Photobacterium phosphoreum]